jgi:hypothetical protein
MDSTLDVRASTAHHKLLMAKQGLLSAWWYKVRWSWNSTRNVLAAETNLLALVRKKQELERLGFEISTVVSPNAVFVHRKPSDATIVSKTVRTPAGS